MIQADTNQVLHGWFEAWVRSIKSRFQFMHGRRKLYMLRRYSCSHLRYGQKASYNCQGTYFDFEANVQHSSMTIHIQCTWIPLDTEQPAPDWIAPTMWGSEAVTSDQTQKLQAAKTITLGHRQRLKSKMKALHGPLPKTRRRRRRKKTPIGSGVDRVGRTGTLEWNVKFLRDGHQGCRFLLRHRHLQRHYLVLPAMQTPMDGHITILPGYNKQLARAAAFGARGRASRRATMGTTQRTPGARTSTSIQRERSCRHLIFTFMSFVWKDVSRIWGKPQLCDAVLFKHHGWLQEHPNKETTTM